MKQQQQQPPLACYCCCGPLIHVSAIGHEPGRVLLQSVADPDQIHGAMLWIACMVGVVYSPKHECNAQLLFVKEISYSVIIIYFYLFL